MSAKQFTIPVFSPPPKKTKEMPDSIKSLGKRHREYWDFLSKPHIQKECRQHKIPVTGNKAALINRYLDFINNT